MIVRSKLARSGLPAARPLLVALVVMFPLGLGGPGVASVAAGGPSAGPGVLGVDLIQNGGFETPVVNATIRTYYAPATFTGWSVDAGSVDLVHYDWPAAAGLQSIDLNGTSAGTLSQTVATTPGTAYELGFSFAGNPYRGSIDHCASASPIKVMEVFWGDESVGVYSFDTTSHSLSDLGWEPIAATVTASTNSTQLRFVSLSPSTIWCGPTIDNVSLVASPGRLTLGSLPSAVAGELYDQTIGVTGGTGPYTYSLDSGSLPRGLSLSAAGRLSGTPASAGTATFTVKATDSSSPAEYGLRAYTLDVLDLATISVRVAAPVNASSAFTVTATALDSSGKKVTRYQGAASWSDLSGALSPAAPAAFVNGISRTSATIGTAFRADRISLTSGAVGGQSGQFNVFGPLASFSVRLQGSVSVPSAMAGAPLAVARGAQFQVKVAARDAVGNSLAWYSGPASWSSLDGALSPAEPTAFANGVSTTTATVAVPYRGDRITIVSGGVSGQSGLFTVVGPLAAIRVRVTTPVTHGVRFAVKATAIDVLGTPLPDYNATASWSSLDGSLAPAAPNPFVNGVSTTTATIPNPFANDRISITRGLVTGQSGIFTVH